MNSSYRGASGFTDPTPRGGPLLVRVFFLKIKRKKKLINN